MANHSYMTITGKTMGLISAGCSSQDSIGNKCQDDHFDEIMVLSYAHSMENIGNIKHATHTPIAITKYIDKSSPLLAEALTRREEIKCEINFYRTSPQGAHEKYYTIKISEGQVACLTTESPHSVLQVDAEPQEVITLRYGTITWTHHIAKTSGYSFWGEDI
ncbi:type VI secretion system tube protein Hcp [Pseudomonas sp. SDI]|uniref:Hcp family type VI secretion system effector n=1 Tax=Pseudomonas sp. SDI TaxID=2170734 RepID=UPI000DE6207C|nr:Hcp family type VI secretion system effector [Pseudomonas sp. SDI]PWB32241.1 type VI secretion system tube protein Hcp [Pseudomonas sp. SDI]